MNKIYKVKLNEIKKDDFIVEYRRILLLIIIYYHMILNKTNQINVNYKP